MSETIFGRNSVLALLRAEPTRIFKLFVAEGLKPERRVSQIFELAKENRIPIQPVPRKKLDDMVGGGDKPQRYNVFGRNDEAEAVHQGVVASVSPKALLNIYQLLDRCKAQMAKGQHPLLLMLDEVTDPRNFGAILRVADATAVDAVIVPKKNSAAFSPVVAKTASGAEATVDVVQVSNLAQTLDQLKEANIWVVGTTDGDRARPYTQQAYDMPVVLVMGSEGEGIGRLIEKKCDFLVRIPMLGTVESLNVATATAVVLFDARARFPMN